MAKLSMNKLDKVIKNQAHDRVSLITFSIDGEDIDIEVKHTIGANEMVSLVSGVVDNLFSVSENGTIVYRPELRNISMAANVLGFYTNMKDGLGNDRLISIAYDSRIMENVVDHISEYQMHDIEDAIDARVAFMIGSIHAEQQAKLNDIVWKLDRAAESFKILNEQFSGVDQDMMAKAIDNLATMTPDKFVDAVVNTRSEDM